MSTDLLAQAKKLSVAERVELAEAIWDSIAADAGSEVLPVPDSHKRELDRRLEDLAADPEADSSWEEVRGRLEQAE